MVSENPDPEPSDAESSSGRTQFSWDGFVQPSTAVAEAVATATDRNPTEMEPIHESIDTDALDKLVTPSDTERADVVHVSFRYEGVDVFVDSHQGIEIRPVSVDDPD